MADVPKLPGFWGGENIFGPNPTVDSFSYTFPRTFLGGAGLPSNAPFMPPDLTTVDPTDKYSQLERDWQNLQKIPEGTRDIFNRIVNEGEPTSIWPVKELFPRITSSEPIRGSAKLIVDALKEGQLTGDPADMERGREAHQRQQARLKAERLKAQRLFKFGGRAAILGSGLWSGGLSKDQDIAPYRREYYTDSEGKKQYTGKVEPIYYGSEDSPFREQLPSNVFPREVRGRQAVEGVAERTRQDIGSAWDATKGFFGGLLGRRPDPNVPDAPIWDPSKEQVPLGTPEELYKQRNDLEEMRLRKIATGMPIGQTFGEGYIPGGEAGLESFFARPDYERQFIRDTGRLPTRAESETGVYDATPKSQFDMTPGAWYKPMPTPDPYNVQGNLIQASLSPNVTYTPPVAPGGPANLEALRGLIKDDPRVAEKYIGPRGGPVAPTQLMKNLQSRTPVETFADIPKTPLTLPTPVVPDIKKEIRDFSVTRKTSEKRRNKEQDKRERALEQAADNRRKNKEKARLASARNKKAEQARINKENRERKAEEQRIASKQAKEEKKRRAIEKQMENMLSQTEETRNAYLRRKKQEEDRRRRAGYGVGAMYT